MLSLNSKVAMSLQRINSWVDEFGTDGVYISFSGGKDSVVLLDLVRSLYPNIEAVYVDTGLEYPEIKEFVKTFDNVKILRPKMTFKQVIEKYGYPMFSKETANKIYEVRRTKSPKLYHTRMYGDSKGHGKIPERYKFMLDDDAPAISGKCCDVMKKSPVKSYEHKTGRKAILGTRADESRMRTTNWMQYGCNVFESHRPISRPLSFWSEQDILAYIVLHHLRVCSVYGTVMNLNTGKPVTPEELHPDEMLFERDQPALAFSGCDRTGCMYCGFGAQLGDDDRYCRLHETHPQIYDYIMRDSGLGFRNVIDWINNHSEFNIKI